MDWTKQGDSSSGQARTPREQRLRRLIDRFNAQHPNGKVTFHELSSQADQQHQQMIQNIQIKNPKMCVLSIDVVWTSQFAANGYVEPMPADVSTRAAC